MSKTGPVDLDRNIQGPKYPSLQNILLVKQSMTASSIVTKSNMAAT